MMDGIFGHDNFQNEIIWKRTSSHNRAKRWGPVHDVILFYSVGQKFTWNRVLQNLDQEYIDDFYKFEDKNGRFRISDLTGPGLRSGDSGSAWRNVDPGARGRHWEPPPDRALPSWFVFPNGYAQKSVRERLEILDGQDLIYWPKKQGGMPGFKRYFGSHSGGALQDIITDIGPISSQSKDRMGYPTQKPIELLDRIIQASTNKGDVVFDPFCGCGTTIYSAVKNERAWIGCDIAILSIKLIREHLTEKYRLIEGHDYAVDGIPVSVEGAQELFNKDPSTFQNWFVERVGGFPMQRKSADRGIDGRIYFETESGLREMMIQVKGGKHVRPTDIRDLRGVLEREENAMLAGFPSMTPPTKAMLSEASEAGTYEYRGVQYPRIQFLTVEDVLVGKKEFHMPTRVNTKISTGQQSFAL
jgi:DNA modification methylase